MKKNTVLLILLFVQILAMISFVHALNEYIGLYVSVLAIIPMMSVLILFKSKCPVCGSVAYLPSRELALEKVSTDYKSDQIFKCSTCGYKGIKGLGL